jgi:hypothetical protein
VVIDLESYINRCAEYESMPTLINTNLIGKQI